MVTAAAITQITPEKPLNEGLGDRTAARCYLLKDISDINEHKRKFTNPYCPYRKNSTNADSSFTRVQKLNNYLGN